MSANSTLNNCCSREIIQNTTGFSIPIPRSIGFLVRVKSTQDLTAANQSLVCLFKLLPLAQVALIVTENKRNALLHSISNKLWDIIVFLEHRTFANPATIPKWFHKLPKTILSNMQQWSRVDILALSKSSSENFLHSITTTNFLTSSSSTAHATLLRLLYSYTPLLIFRTSLRLDQALACAEQTERNTFSNIHILEILPRRWFCQSQSEIDHWGAHCLFLHQDEKHRCPLNAFMAYSGHILF